jgi:hypothetical protein
MVATVTLGTAGVSYVVLNPDRLEDQAQSVADQATCRTVDSAIVAFVAATGADPTSTAELARYVRGDITAYRIVDGQAAGPGC